MNRLRDRCHSSYRPSLPPVFASHLPPPEVAGPNPHDRYFLARRPKPEPIGSRESKPNLCRCAVPNARSGTLPSRNLHSKSKSNLGPYGPSARRCRVSSCHLKSRRQVARLLHKWGRQTSGHLTAGLDKRHHKIAVLRNLAFAPRLNWCFGRSSPNALLAEAPGEVVSLPPIVSLDLEDPQHRYAID